MPSIHRKIVETSKKLYESCDVCYFCPYGCTNYSSPPPPPPTASHHHFSTVLILLICGSGLLFLLFSYLIIARYRALNRRNSRRMDQSQVLGNDENHGPPVMDHYVWYIHRVGLPQSLIDSIPVFDYRRGEKTKQSGSDHCPVCLSEFQENESLRLLPKCGHTFHVLCIDTWLRSYKNCPVCRSPVSINDTDASVANSANMDSDHPGSIQGPEFGTMETTDTGAVHENGGETRSLSRKARGFRVLSDLGDGRVLGVDRELERVRRSVSMDCSSDSVLVESHANKLDQGCSDT